MAFSLCNTSISHKLLLSEAKQANIESIVGSHCTSTEKTGDADDLLPNLNQHVYNTIIYALFSWSLLISFAQIIFLVALLYNFGTVPIEYNPYLGPSISTLIRFGAKDAELIIKSKEYWRLISAIMLHAGVYHLLGNVTLQLIISGHLEHAWGIGTFATIYFSTGVVGYLSSCCCLYASVSVGSSGSIMGLLASWLVDIAFSLQKMRYERIVSAVTMRNQYIIFYSVMTAAAITLATSWNNGVDWASHAGGYLYGLIWGYVFFCDRQENELAVLLPVDTLLGLDSRKKVVLRMAKMIAIILIFCIPIALIIFMIYFIQDVEINR